MRSAFAILVLIGLAACADRRHDIAQARLELPPVGLGAQAIWLEKRGGVTWR